jgi:hypothetical protein
MLRWHPVVDLGIVDAEPEMADREFLPWHIPGAPKNLGSFQSLQAALDGLNDYCLKGLKEKN